ncbi:MAG: acetolactate decarboxylase [Bacteroidia bacterium]
MRKILFFITISIALQSCKTQNHNNHNKYDDIKITGAMKNVMWKGELGGKINLDTISNKKGLYGIGPVSYLIGELLINNGKSYVSKVLDSANMVVEENYNVEAPFFVYGNVTEWNKLELPETVNDIKALEQHLDSISADFKRPFIFKLIGTVNSASIHIQNLAKGSIVRSPDGAHKGQINYLISNKEVEIIGFFSTEHQAVFTHHDSYMHMHLITKDKSQMGHLDKVDFTNGNITLYLPTK